MVLALVTVICLPGVALAVTDYSLGQLENAGYGNGWYSDPLGITFDQMETYFTGPNVLSTATVGGNAGTFGFATYYGGPTVAGWVGTTASNTHTSAAGPAVSNMTWDYNFAGDQPNTVFPLTITIEYFNSGKELGYEAYTFTSGSSYSGGYTPVPLPPSMLLLGSGLLGLVGLRWRRKSSA